MEMTDREIIDFIKKDIINGWTADFLVLDIDDKTDGRLYCFSEYCLDEMFKTLFDISLTKKVIGVQGVVHNPSRLDASSSKMAYNGSPAPIIGYSLVVTESQDGQTNITPKLMKFIETIMNRYLLSRLAFPMRHSREIEFHNFDIGEFIHMPPDDPWDAVEAYLRDEDEPNEEGGLL